MPGIGRAYAQCKLRPAPISSKRAEPCVLHFARVSRNEHIKVARAIERMGYRVVGGGVDTKGSAKLASDIRFVKR